MSGTSLDGIDLAFAKISKTHIKSSTQQPVLGEKTHSYSAEILKAETIAYPPPWSKKLSEAFKYAEDDLKNLDKSYTAYLGDQINHFITKNDLQHIDAICSHGHTILHQPENRCTLQIGNRPEIAKILGKKVVCDFRVQDVALGGQGAPLVPIGDKMLYSKYDYCLNLGGFANVSMEKDAQRIAYDICPVNVVLNTYAQRLGRPYDDKGALANAGNVSKPLLKELNALSFYSQSAPKSLGMEWVNDQIFPLLQRFEEKDNLSDLDILATFTEHIAIQLLAQFEDGSSVLITGGGAYNEYLMELLHFRESITFILPSEELIEFKEALVFALLGVLKLENEINCLASVTGAQQDHSSGVIHLP